MVCLSLLDRVFDWHANFRNYYFTCRRILIPFVGLAVVLSAMFILTVILPMLAFFDAIYTTWSWLIEPRD